MSFVTGALDIYIRTKIPPGKEVMCTCLLRKEDLALGCGQEPFSVAFLCINKHYLTRVLALTPSPKHPEKFHKCVC